MRFDVLLPVLAHLAVFFAVTLRVLSRRNPPGVAMAWILMVLLVPVGGLVLYVMIGERRLGRRWIVRAEAERAALASGRWVGDHNGCVACISICSPGPATSNRPPATKATKSHDPGRSVVSPPCVPAPRSRCRLRNGAPRALHSNPQSVSALL